MEVLPIEMFGIAIEVPFASPQGIQSARLEEFGAKLCDPKKGLNLRPDQFKLKKWDDLFQFEFSAQFFGENGTLSRTADKVKLAIRNARTAGDWTIIQQMFCRFYEIMDFDDSTTTNLSMHVHAKFPNSMERDEFMKQFAFSPLMHKPAALGYVMVAEWDKEIRVLIEASNVVQDALFIAWDTRFTNEQEWDSFFGSLPSVTENAAHFFELAFEPFRDRV